jgi:hypothetical protein
MRWKTMMSEQFKKKWENYWYYYKWHTFAGIFVLIIMLVTITQCASNVQPDITVMLVSKTSPILTTTTDSIQNDLAQYVTDLNKDGKKTVNFISIDFSSTDPTMLEAEQTKFMGELQTTDSFIFLIDASAYSEYSKQGIFAKVKDIIPNAPTVDDYRIPVSNLAAFKNKSYDAYLKNYYFVIRQYNGTFLDKTANNLKYQNSVNFLKRIIANSKTA